MGIVLEIYDNCTMCTARKKRLNGVVIKINYKNESVNN